MGVGGATVGVCPIRAVTLGTSVGDGDAEMAGMLGWEVHAPSMAISIVSANGMSGRICGRYLWVLVLQLPILMRGCAPLILVAAL